MSKVVDKVVFCKGDWDTWLVLDCGHYTRQLDGVAERDHSCTRCDRENDEAWVAEQARLKRKEAVDRKARAAREKVLSQRAARIRRQEEDEKLKRGFFWRGKYRETL